MTITAKAVAGKLDDYLHHRLSLPELVDWAETAMLAADFEPKRFEAVRDTVARLGLADVREFGLTWEDCEQLLTNLGYAVDVSVRPAPAAVREKPANYGK